MMIVPALLEESTEKLIAHIKRIMTELPGVPHLHIDIMDGQLVASKNEINPAELASVSTPKLELHLMVNDPVAEMRRWRELESVFRVLFHIEAPTDHLKAITFARKEGWDVGVVLNPDSPLAAAEALFPRVDVVQCMSVHPGHQGAPFVPEILEKIKTFTSTEHVCEYSKQPVVCAADGAVNSETIVSLKNAGVQVFNVGSFLTKAADIKQAYQSLVSLLK